MTIKFGIIGSGRIANRHAQHISQYQDGELLGIYDVDKNIANAFSKEHEVTSFENLDDLLAIDDIDVVNVCSPNGLHMEHAIKVMNAGKHVVIEKPMALKKSECEAIIQTGLKNNKQIFIVKQNRYNPPIQLLKEKLVANELGKILAVNVNCYWNRNDAYYTSSSWKGKKALDGGTLFTQFSHFIDILYYLFGEIENISGIMKNCGHGGLIEFEDTGFFSFNFKNGALGNFNYTTCSYAENMEGSITIFGEQGTIKIGGKYMNTIDYQKTNNVDIENTPISSPANNYGFYEGSMSNHDKMIENVIKTLQGKDTIMTNSMEGMKVVEMIENIYKSCQYATNN